MKPPPIVLIVDDNRNLCTALRALLLGEGFEPRVAGDWLEAMRCLEGEHVDAIVLDLMLPDFDGFQILESLHRNPKFAHLPVVVSTALSSPVDLARARACGAAEVMTKPYRPTDLAVVLRKVLDAPGLPKGP